MGRRRSFKNAKFATSRSLTFPFFSGLAGSDCVESSGTLSADEVVVVAAAAAAVVGVYVHPSLLDPAVVMARLGLLPTPLVDWKEAFLLTLGLGRSLPASLELVVWIEPRLSTDLEMKRTRNYIGSSYCHLQVAN